jgi:acyl phosphate:glycerol-3-phosphate acyltransferase
MTWIENLPSANWPQAGILGAGAYALGCITAGYYLVRMRTGQDVRETGSGSVGARNVSRLLGKTGFLLTVFFDFCKGVLAVFAANHFTSDERLVALTVLAVIVGHIWPVQLRFRGGKGMATSLGCLLGYDPHLALAFTMIFLGLFIFMRKTVLPGLLALACVPLASQVLHHSPIEVIQFSLVAGLVLVAHRKNIHEEISQLIPRRPDPTKPDHLLP